MSDRRNSRSTREYDRRDERRRRSRSKSPRRFDLDRGRRGYETDGERGAVTCYSCGEPGHFSTTCPKKGQNKKLQEIATRYAMKEVDLENLETLLRNLGGIPADLCGLRSIDELREFNDWKARRRAEEEEERLARTVRRVMEEERLRSSSRKISRRAAGKRKRDSRREEEEESEEDYDEEESDEDNENSEKLDGTKGVEAKEVPAAVKKIKGKKERTEWLRRWFKNFDSDQEAVNAFDEALGRKIKRGKSRKDGGVAITYVLEDLLCF